VDTVRLVATLIPLSVSSGINLYATVLVAGLSIRFGWVHDVPPSLEVLASWPVILTAGIMFVIETFADKVPFLDNLWDLVHTPIRPLGAALMTLTALGRVDPVVGLVATMVSGGIALISHGGKAGTRVALNVASPAENLSNIGLSIVEDVIAGGLAFIALKFPFEASAIAIVILALILLIVPQLLRWAWFTLTSVLALIQAAAMQVRGKTRQPDSLPTAHRILLRHEVPSISAWCRAQGIKGAGGRAGYISVLADQIAFSYNTLRGPRAWTLRLGQIRASYLDHRLVGEALQVHYRDEKGKERVIRFMFQKNRSALAGQVARRVGARIETAGGAEAPQPAKAF
jgi:hypothetical protein